MNKDLPISLIRKGHGYGLVVAACLAPVFLLIMRLHWDWKFFEMGKGNHRLLSANTPAKSPFCEGGFFWQQPSAGDQPQERKKHNEIH
jgi:hypothetical protein